MSSLNGKRKRNDYDVSTSSKYVDKNGDTHSSYDWTSYLKGNPNSDGASPTCFAHVSLNKDWDLIGREGLMIEINSNPKARDHFWRATIQKLCGYMALVQYVGGELLPDDEHEKLSCRWINIITMARPVGHVDKLSSRKMVPPEFWERDMFKELDVTEFLREKLVGMETIPGGLWMPEYKYKDLYVGKPVEVLDVECISKMKLGMVVQLLGGRVHVRYWDSELDPSEFDFACHEKSDWIRPIGWSRATGVEISAPQGFVQELDDSAIKSLVPDYDLASKISIKEGMKLEAVDFRRRDMITSAFVKKVLNHGYILVSNDHTEDNLEEEPIFYHITSPMIFPCGFCQKWGIPFAPPKEYNGEADDFCWEEYFIRTKNVPLPITELRNDDDNDDKDYGFKVGMKLEAMGLLECEMICPATVKGVYGRLLQLSFDGWDDSYDQWMDVKSPEIYPVGWCRLNWYMLRYPGDYGDYWDDEDESSSSSISSSSSFEENKENEEEQPSSSKRLCTRRTRATCS